MLKIQKRRPSKIVTVRRKRISYVFEWVDLSSLRLKSTPINASYENRVKEEIRERLWKKIWESCFSGEETPILFAKPPMINPTGED